ncbi:alpha/beta fold hydrolase [Nocardioides marmoribigeumensis]|uniref:Pimeloyl-ACP methyl ester carboxylesterase n=1 Tax=Nocardioides marmoribigeumensis TaxID=433649 RepID=A0ABU2C1Q5_9ACTN|nr:alpha/beta hydrolase [Nocardioides marmoribigeumensis]MDR7364571.1 pimeloyl-ACP methyl ester carboxylesterase [Nocardioides marmoribigeumensis]
MVSARVEAWRDRGRYVEVEGHSIFVVERDGAGTPVVVVHGYPGSSHDFAQVVDRLDRPVVVFDLLGYGFSAKPADASYSLFEQADLVEALLRHLGIGACALVGHDMGTTVVAELLSRANRGALGFAVTSVVLLNGSIFIDLAQLTRGQRLGLLAHGRRLPFAFPVSFLRRNIRESVAPGTNLGDEQLEDLVDLIRLDGGDRLLTRQINYVRERRAHQATWTAALVEFPGRLSAVWGVLDPIAVTAMPQRLAALRPGTDVVLLAGVGHWPSIEAPERVAAEIAART